MRESLNGAVVQSEIENRLHHAGHRHGRTGSNRNEQRIVRIAEALAGRLLEAPHVLIDFLLETRRARGRRGETRCSSCTRS